VIDALNHFVFVLLPVFGLGFQAILLPVFFFLKARDSLSLLAFASAGALTGTGYGYVFAQFTGAQSQLVACLGVAAFGVVSAGGWWYLLVKREDTEGD